MVKRRQKGFYPLKVELLTTVGKHFIISIVIHSKIDIIAVS